MSGEPDLTGRPRGGGARTGALAFQANGQTKAYYADSTSGARDRQNVRDGHYPIWGPVHFFTTWKVR